MPRPSRNHDRLLLESGRRLLSLHGASGLSLRQVAEDAGVNLGMFHYHFGTKDQFVRAVLGETYERFLAELVKELGEEAQARDPLERLRGALRTLGRFALAHRDLMASLMRDVMNGEKAVAEFIGTNAPRHLGLLLAVIRECQRRGRIRDDLPAEQALVAVASAILAATVLCTAASRANPGLLPKAVEPFLFTPESIDARIDVVLEGLIS